MTTVAQLVAWRSSPDGIRVDARELSDNVETWTETATQVRNVFALFQAYRGAVRAQHNEQMERASKCRDLAELARQQYAGLGAMDARGRSILGQEFAGTPNSPGAFADSVTNQLELPVRSAQPLLHMRSPRARLLALTAILRRKVNEFELACGPQIIAAWQDQAEATLPIGTAVEPTISPYSMPLQIMALVLIVVVAPILGWAHLLVAGGTAGLGGFGLLMALRMREARHEREIGMSRVDRARQLLSD